MQVVSNGLNVTVKDDFDNTVFFTTDQLLEAFKVLSVVFDGDDGLIFNNLEFFV